MRSRLFLCAALAGSCLFGSWSPVAHAADPKAKKAKASDSDDKVINKQMQWEESVMGPDDGKRAELDKIARAQAINKAASEKAAKEKEKADAQAAREKEKADAAPKTSKRGGEVALPTLPDEDSGKGKNGNTGRTSEISPKLETTAAAAPPPPVKHGDDKFIDKLLKDDGGSKKHKASAGDDKALDDLLAVEKPKAAPAKGKKKGDDVDSLLSSADKAPPMPETHVKHETPEWAKPEISSTPVEAPTPLVRPQPKKNDGIIHVTQGAASSGAAAPTPSTRRTPAAAPPPPPPARTPTVASRGAASRRQAAPASGNWNDPFAVSGPKKTVAARAAHSDSGADDLDNLTPVNRRHPPSPARSDDDDSFTNAKATAGTRRAAPAAKPKWKDPFTSSAAPAPAPTRAKVATRSAAPAHTTVASHSAAPAPAPARTTIASREPQKGESSKWDVAAHHGVAAAESPAQGRSGRWGVLKKHAH
jgi:hypothetical protein